LSSRGVVRPQESIHSITARPGRSGQIPYAIPLPDPKGVGFTDPLSGTLKQPHNLHKWLDLRAKKPQHAGGGIPLGECRVKYQKALSYRLFGLMAARFGAGASSRLTQPQACSEKRNHFN